MQNIDESELNSFNHLREHSFSHLSPSRLSRPPLNLRMQAGLERLLPNLFVMGLLLMLERQLAGETGAATVWSVLVGLTLPWVLCRTLGIERLEQDHLLIGFLVLASAGFVLLMVIQANPGWLPLLGLLYAAIPGGWLSSLPIFDPEWTLDNRLNAQGLRAALEEEASPTQVKLEQERRLVRRLEPLPAWKQTVRRVLRVMYKTFGFLSLLIGALAAILLNPEFFLEGASYVLGDANESGIFNLLVLLGLLSHLGISNLLALLVGLSLPGIAQRFSKSPLPMFDWRWTATLSAVLIAILISVPDLGALSPLICLVLGRTLSSLYKHLNTFLNTLARVLDKTFLAFREIW